MKVSIQVSVNLVGSKPPRPEWFAQLVQDAMREYFDSRRVREAESEMSGLGVMTEAEAGLPRAVALQIASQIPQVQVAPDIGEG
jgi:hypothetical protein